MKKLLVTAVMACSMTNVLTGCATTAVPASEAKPAPANRVLAFQSKDETTTSTIVVTRDAGFLGGGCFYSLAINKVLAARLDTSETAAFYVAPGEVLLRSGRDPEGKALCSLGQDEWTQTETILKPNETKYFRLSIDMNGKTDIRRSDR